VSVINAFANIYVQKIQIRMRGEDRKEARVAWLREKRLIAFTALSEELIVFPREPEHIDLSKSYQAAAQVSILISDPKLADKIRSYASFREMLQENVVEHRKNPDDKEVRTEMWENHKRVRTDSIEIAEQLRQILLNSSDS